MCFDEQGNEADYIRIDRPLTLRKAFPLKGMYDPVCRFTTQKQFYIKLSWYIACVIDLLVLFPGTAFQGAPCDEGMGTGAQVGQPLHSGC